MHKGAQCVLRSLKPVPWNRGWKKPFFCLESSAAEQEKKERWTLLASLLLSALSYHVPPQPATARCPASRTYHATSRGTEEDWGLHAAKKMHKNQCATQQQPWDSAENARTVQHVPWSTDYSISLMSVDLTSCPELPRKDPKCKSFPAALAATPPALIREAISPTHESLKRHSNIHQKTTIPEEWIPGTLQGGVQGLGSRTSLIQGPVIKVKWAHISLLYMQFKSWHIILHGTFTLSQMNIEQISPLRIPVNCTNTGIRHEQDINLQKCRWGITHIYTD